MNRQDACSTRDDFFCGTGILPVLENGATSQLLLRYCTIFNKHFMNRQDACSTRNDFFCGTGILPVLENGARCELLQINITWGEGGLINIVEVNERLFVKPAPTNITVNLPKKI
ncbi:hypothetical protein [Microcoleus sp. BROC3]|uniref:hypothetical protein n=1 Tax=Microcoleus sp. BROC3 TaxID=3055323 RepID=UPI002FD41AC6